MRYEFKAGDHVPDWVEYVEMPNGGTYTCTFVQDATVICDEGGSVRVYCADDEQSYVRVSVEPEDAKVIIHGAPTQFMLPDEVPE